MIKSFKEIDSLVHVKEKKKIAVAQAEDVDVLKAVDEAYKCGYAESILFGNKNKIIEIEDFLGIKSENFEIIDSTCKEEACKKAVSFVSSGKADIVMKGIVDTSTFLKAVLDKDYGLRTGKILSHVAVFQIPLLEKILIITDCAMNIAPDLNAKMEIINNSVSLARKIGIECPKVAVICAVENVNPQMQSTLDAALLSKMCERGQIKNCIVDGPLALDNAISKEAAEHKGIVSQVAGYADIIVVPNIESGNIMYKTLTYMAGAKNGGLIIGASKPVVITSRADSSESKLNSIALACLM